jgi:hypothetical protein
MQLRCPTTKPREVFLELIAGRSRGSSDLVAVQDDIESEEEIEIEFVLRRAIRMKNLLVSCDRVHVEGRIVLERWSPQSSRKSSR